MVGLFLKFICRNFAAVRGKLRSNLPSRLWNQLKAIFHRTKGKSWMLSNYRGAEIEIDMKFIVCVLVFGEIGFMWTFEGGRKRNVTNFVVKHVQHADRWCLLSSRWLCAMSTVSLSRSCSPKKMARKIQKFNHGTAGNPISCHGRSICFASLTWKQRDGGINLRNAN